MVTARNLGSIHYKTQHKEAIKKKLVIRRQISFNFMYAIDVLKSIDHEFQNIKEKVKLWPLAYGKLRKPLLKISNQF